MKYAYTGEVAMAKNRVDGFFEAARSLEMFGLMSNESLEKYKKKKKTSRADLTLEEATRPAPAVVLPRLDNEEVANKLNHLNVSDNSASSTDEEPIFKEARKRKPSLEDDAQVHSFKKPKTVFFDVDLRDTLSQRCKYCFRFVDPASGNDLKSHELRCASNPNHLNNSLRF